MIILNALWELLVNYNKNNFKKMDMTVATGLSMTIGGGLLCIISAIIGPASKWTINIKSIITMVGLILISAVCFGVYNQLLAYLSNKQNSYI